MVRVPRRTRRCADTVPVRGRDPRADLNTLAAQRFGMTRRRTADSNDDHRDQREHPQHLPCVPRRCYPWPAREGASGARRVHPSAAGV